MAVIFLLIGIALAIFIIVNILRHLLTSSRILKAFKQRNCVVTGAQGYGKDVLFSYVINKRKEEHNSNIQYYDYTEKHAIKDYELAPNTYENFIEGNVVVIPKNDKFEGKDYYLSDAGVHLPSQMDSLLHKKYKSLPIVYAMFRQCYNAHFHINVQRLGRYWKALREQADYYIDLRKPSIKLPFFIVLFTTEYDKYESASQRVAPLNALMFNKYSKADKQRFKSTYGFVKNGILIIPKWILKYDTREFHKVLFGVEAPRKVTLWTKLKKLFHKRSKQAKAK